MSGGFVDEARIFVRAGDGGPGAASFHREKYKPKGGPDGGDGGHGGSIVLEATTSVGSLAAFKRHPHRKAKSGGSGGGNNKRGADADDVVCDVPVGTVVRETGTGEVLADLAREGATFVVARGGIGGRGNASLTSRIERAPSFAERGEPGEEVDVTLELRLVADVGLVGPPNAGKSTLLGAISRAHPKVAEYPFTTLEPHLGVVDVDDERIVVADLPGLIEGAAEGRGLGTRFLRHAERCAVLAATVDLALDDPAAELDSIRTEVAGHSPELAERIRVVIGNKLDLPDARPGPAEGWASRHGARFCGISALLGEGTEGLVKALVAEVERAHAERGEPETFAVFRPVEADRLVVEREDDAFRVRSERVERLVDMTPLANPSAVRHLQRRLNALGVEAALIREGAQEGDEVRIGEVAFEFYPEGEP